MHLSSVLLPEPFSPIKPVGRALLDLERHVVERPEVLVAGPAAARERRLQALVAVVVEPELLARRCGR